MARVGATGDSTMRCTSPAGGLGEVLFEAHLAFEVGEQRLDDQPQASLADLGVGVSGRAVAVGSDHRDAMRATSFRVLRPTSPCRRTGCSRGGRRRARERSGILGVVGGDEVVADGDAVGVADEDEAHAPDILALGRAVAEGRAGQRTRCGSRSSSRGAEYRRAPEGPGTRLPVGEIVATFSVMISQAAPAAARAGGRRPARRACHAPRRPPLRAPHRP